MAIGSTNVLGSPQADAAAIAGSVSIFVSMITIFVANRRAKTDRLLTELKWHFDKEIAEQRASSDADLIKIRDKIENRERVAVELLLQSLFSDPRYPQRIRTFAQIRSKLLGFEDNEIRKFLILTGARVVAVKSGREAWRLSELKDAEDE